MLHWCSIKSTGVCCSPPQISPLTPAWRAQLLCTCRGLRPASARAEDRCRRSPPPLPPEAAALERHVASVCPSTRVALPLGCGLGRVSAGRAGAAVRTLCWSAANRRLSGMHLRNPRGAKVSRMSRTRSPALHVGILPARRVALLHVPPDASWICVPLQEVANWLTRAPEAPRLSTRWECRRSATEPLTRRAQKSNNRRTADQRSVRDARKALGSQALVRVAHSALQHTCRRLHGG